MAYGMLATLVVVAHFAFIVFVMFVWPFIDRWLARVLRVPEISVWIGIAGVAAILTLTVWEAAVAH